MSSILDINSLRNTLIAAGAITLGVLYKNGSEQYGKKSGKDMSMLKKLGILLFVLGWVGIVYFLTFSNGKFNNTTRSYIVISAAIAIVGSVFMLKKEEKTYGENKNKKLFVGLFILGWLALGYATGMGGSNTAKYLGWLAPIFVLISMLFILPFARKNNIVDNGGMLLFGIGWVCLAASNSMVN